MPVRREIALHVRYVFLMATIIRRTNPDRLKTRNPSYSCAACEAKYNTADEARLCAERDHGYVSEYKHNRNYIRVGDTVCCVPLVGSKFDARVLKIRIDPVTKAIEVQVIGAQGRKGVSHIRTFRPDRIIHKAQSRIEKRES